jgi:hypothetical protein
MSDSPTLRLGATDFLVVPAHAVLPNDRASVERLVQDALADPSSRATLASWLGVDEADLDTPDVRAIAIERMTSGSWRAIEVEPPRHIGRPLVPRSDPTEPRKPTDGPRTTERTWIALTIVDEDGRGFAGTSWTLTTADGDDRSVRLDDASTWRADDLELSGTCHLRIGSAVPDAGAPLAMQIDAAEHPWIESEARASVPLRTGAAHTVVVVHGRTEIVLLDEAGWPEPDEWCEVMIDGRVRKRRTDAQGLIVVVHPRRVTSVEARFVLLSPDAVALERSGPLASERDA